MGTYKHIGRIRSARLIGREVASFYIQLGEVQNAAAFLTDALRTFEQDGWRELAAQTQMELAECYKKFGDVRKHTRFSALVAAAPEIDNLIRWSYFDEMRKNLDKLEKSLIVPFKDIFKIVSITLKNDGPVMQDADIDVELVIESSFPREILCNEIVISLELDTRDLSKSKDKSDVTMITSNDLKPQDAGLRRLKMHKHLDYKQDKQLSSANVVCSSSPVKRADSIAAQHRSDFVTFLETKTVSFKFIFLSILTNIFKNFCFSH